MSTTIPSEPTEKIVLSHRQMDTPRTATRRAMGRETTLHHGVVSSRTQATLDGRVGSQSPGLVSPKSQNGGTKTTSNRGQSDGMCPKSHVDTNPQLRMRSHSTNGPDSHSTSRSSPV